MGGLWSKVPDTEDTVVFRRHQTGTRQATGQQKAQCAPDTALRATRFRRRNQPAEGTPCPLRGRKEVTIAKDRDKWQNLQAGHGWSRASRENTMMPVVTLREKPSPPVEAANTAVGTDGTCLEVRAREAGGRPSSGR